MCAARTLEPGRRIGTWRCRLAARAHLDDRRLCAMISTGAVCQNCHGFDRHAHGGARHGRVRPLARRAVLVLGLGRRRAAGRRRGRRRRRAARFVTRSTSFPFCFDWTADGTLLVTGHRGLERLGPDGQLVPHVDLSDLSDFGWNEVAVHPAGDAYVNGINFDMRGGGHELRARLAAWAHRPGHA